jgi:hypothetical protein
MKIPRGLLKFWYLLTNEDAYYIMDYEEQEYERRQHRDMIVKRASLRRAVADLDDVMLRRRLGVEDD